MANDPFEAPTRDAAVAAADEVDPSAARPGLLVGAIGFGIVVAGLAAAMYWPQLLAFGVTVRTFMKVVPPLITALGLGLVPLGAMVAAGRFWAAALAAPALGAALLLQLVWGAWALANGGFTLLYPFAPVLTALGLGAVAVALPLTWRISAARRALLEG